MNKLAIASFVVLTATLTFLDSSWSAKACWQVLNAEAKKSIKQKITKLYEGHDKAELRAQAEQIVQALQPRFDGMFAQTSGFQTVAEFERSMVAAGGLGASLHTLVGNGVEAAIYRQTRRRTAITKSGLLNQHTTRTSGGSMNLQLRERAEADLLGLPYGEYKLLHSEIKPKSAMLQFKPDTDTKLKRLANIQYGNDAYILKDEVLAKRATLTPQDSLNRYIVGHQIHTPTIRKSHPAQAWDQLYIPWGHRTLIVPYIVPEAYMFYRLSPTGDPYFFMQEDENALPHIQALRQLTPEQKLQISEEWGDGNQSYVEVQVWGPIDLDDVKAFQFSSTPPSGAFLDELLKRNIEIRDARDNEPKYDQYGRRQYFTDSPIKIWKTTKQ